MRRRFLLGAAALPFVARAGAADPAALLRQGGAVVLFRHALAPGTFDPPGLVLSDCSTQRNLSDEGRAQARRLGDWFRARGLKPAAVKTSPWCRCIDTAQLAFGSAEVWPALGSPSGRPEAERSAQVAALRAELAQVRPGRFEVWVTHQFVISALAPTATDSAEGVIFEAGSGRVLGRLPPP